MRTTPISPSAPRFGLVLYTLWLSSTAAWWLLALAPLPGEAPDWLTRTRYLCFGSSFTGVPDAAGWITLTSPFLMLAALLALQGRELRAELGALPRALTWVMVLTPFLIVGAGAVRIEQARRVQAAATDLQAPLGAMPESYPRTARQMPPFHLVDQFGEAVTPATLAGRPAVITFVYAHCATVCPGVMASLRQVRDARRVLITLDPRRDTPASLPDLARDWRIDGDPAPPRDKASLILSGRVDEVEQAARDFGVPFERSVKDGQITHPGLVFVIDAEGRIVYTFNNPRADWIGEAIRRTCERN